MPRIALVAYDVGTVAGEGRAMLEMIRRAGDRAHWIVVAPHVDPELEAVVDWRRAPTPRAPYRLRAIVSLAVSSLRVLTGGRHDLLHVAGPLVPLRADLVTLQFLRSAFYDAIEARRSIQTRLHLALERWCVARARALAVPSLFMEREVHRRFPGTQVFRIPNGVDRSRYAPDATARAAVRDEMAVPDERVVVLFVGNAFGQKGLGIAIEALARARAAGADLELWVAGYGTWDRYHAIAQREGVDERTHYFGVRRDLDRLYRGADVLVLPSSFEAFPLVLLEAAASALPVVITRVGGVEEVIGADEAGVVVERTPESVAAALVALAGDPVRRAALGRAARERTAAFTWEKLAESYLDVYETLLREAPEPVAA